MFLKHKTFIYAIYGNQNKGWENTSVSLNGMCGVVWHGKDSLKVNKSHVDLDMLATLSYMVYVS